MPRRWWVASGVAMILCFVAANGCNRGGREPGAVPGPPKVAAIDDVKASESARAKVAEQVPGDAIEALEHADSFVLYSLDPAPIPEDADQGERPGGWAVLGKVEVADPATRRGLVEALWRGVAENQGMVAGCFNPRHAIRITYQGKTIDWVICFECLSVRVTEGSRRGGFLTTASPQPAFDKVLTDAGVALPPKRTP